MSALAELFRLGGPLMWPLALCSALLMAFLIERAIAVSSAQWKSDERQRTLHRRHLHFFVEVAPALGLLGTMQGIIECFKIVGGSGPGMSALQGLGIACITTVYGLVIALIAQVATYVLDSLARAEGEGAVPAAVPAATPIPSTAPCVPAIQRAAAPLPETPAPAAAHDAGPLKVQDASTP